ncbi:TPA: DUF1672 domain-containing protein [Staphylococcus aureus]|nr:DUF1672 domain-containing protein [Staphylococcus aureus]HCV8235004.1 DUF1672 domain-containing protein [Staphylococcus aureus]
MFKRTKLILIATLLLSGCSTIENETKEDTNTETKSVPEEMEASKYVGQGFQPPAEKDAIEFAKKHKDKIAKRGEQFFMDNFGLKVKATNVVGSGDGVEVYVHCDDHDIVFNASIPFDKSIIDSDSSLRSEDKGDDMSTLVGTVLSGFEYRAHKEELDNLTEVLKEYKYTGYTENAIMKTQNSGFRNEYYYLTAIPYTLDEYKRYFQPLIKEDDKSFRDGMRNSKKQLKDKSRPYVVTTLFSTKDNFTKDNTIDEMIDFSEVLKKKKNIPHDLNVSLQISNKYINTTRPNYSKKDVIEVGVFNHEKTNTND